MIGEIFRLLIPLWTANVALNIFSLFRRTFGWWDFPLDAGIHFIDRKPLFGPAKTVLGLPVALVFGFLGGFIVQTYDGLWLGLLAYIGTVGSGFLKRRLGLKRGEPLWIVDQSDYLLAAYVLYYLLGKTISTEVFITSLAIAIPVHFLTNIIAFRLKIRETRW